MSFRDLHRVSPCSPCRVVHTRQPPSPPAAAVGGSFTHASCHNNPPRLRPCEGRQVPPPPRSVERPTQPRRCICQGGCRRESTYHGAQLPKVQSRPGPPVRSTQAVRDCLHTTPLKAGLLISHDANANETSPWPQVAALPRRRQKIWSGCLGP